MDQQLLHMTPPKPFVGKEEAKAAYDTINNSWLSMGTKVKHFEKCFADLVDAKYAIATNNGTTALHVAIIAAGIKDPPGDPVISIRSLFLLKTIVGAIVLIGFLPASNLLPVLADLPLMDLSPYL